MAPSQRIGYLSFRYGIRGLLRPDRGRILFGPAGRDLVGLTPHAIARLGIGRTFQIQRLFPQPTVLERG